MAEGPTPPGTATPLPPGTAARLGRLAPYGIGAVVALGAVLVFTLLNPARPSLTEQQVDEAITNALASVTPPPAYSQQVYQFVQPSLVLIRTEGMTDPDGEGDDERDGLGSGVVVNL